MSGFEVQLTDRSRPLVAEAVEATPGWLRVVGACVRRWDENEDGEVFSFLTPPRTLDIPDRRVKAVRHG